MKNFKSHLLSLAGLLAMLTFISCGEDDPVTADLPSVTITATVDGEALADGGDVVGGSTINWTISVTAPGGVNGLDVGGTSYSRSELGADAGDTSGSLMLSSETSEDDLGDKLVTITAVDDLNQTTTVTFSFTVVEPASPDAKVQTAIILAAPLGDGSSTTFYSVGQNLLYSHNDVTGTAEAVSPNIDFGYYYGENDGASLVSPSEYPSAVFDISAWGTKNETPMFQIVDFSNEEFMALSSVKDVTDVLETLSEETFVTGYTGLEVGSVFAFETAGGIAGILRVQELSTGFTGSVELEMVLAEAAATEE